MKKNFCFVLLLSALYLNAQKTSSELYFFKSDWSQTKTEDGAAFLLHKSSDNDSVFICKIYNINGPMISWQTYADSSLHIKNGIFAWYNKSGNLDSVGRYKMGVKDQLWEYNFSVDNNPRILEEYNDGVLKRRVDYVHKSTQNEAGVLSPLKGDQKTYSFTAVHNLPVDKPALFHNGGNDAWVDYLRNDINTPIRFIKIAGPFTTGVVGTQFTVDVNGKISEVFIFSSREWSVDLEAIRIIKESDLWDPAVFKGEKVPFTHRQKLNFQVNR